MLVLVNYKFTVPTPSWTIETLYVKRHVNSVGTFSLFPIDVLIDNTVKASQAPANYLLQMPQNAKSANRIFGCATGTFIAECLQQKKLRWLGHVLRMANHRLPN
ncbi:hypothetical protein T265_03759 [Opisthorchis viverrini]|uniref:Uncharacterized protein n=1 Tax=Opisthorchis viverrini TaxID=6198 RepID=A0A075AHC6_OPIVI|nr:hypothetical protein T265_03759 [Opisthorchis viverrini]KER29649.1 hypothetical protein T265_03759 [Opisthorchis viverrini]